MKLVHRFTKRLLAAAILLGPAAANACTACMGDPNTNIAKGANAAIFLMLGLLGGMFALIAAFGVYLYRRAKAPIPPHAELGAGIDPQAEGSPG